MALPPKAKAGRPARGTNGPRKAKRALGARRGADAEHEGDAEGTRGGRRLRKAEKGGTKKRKEWRDYEESEIKNLELRLATEAPKRGSGAAGIDVGGGDPEQTTGGPALTAHLFKDLPISKKSLKGLASVKYTKMTEIQRSAIPHALCGRDILGEAKTGSGKTLAFLVPLVELLFRRRWTQMDGLGALVVSPTRELAFQIFQVLTGVGSDHDFSAGCIVGGRDLEDEQKAVATMNILIATPGRLLQHLDESPGFDASNLQMLVLDEADRILDFGFQETLHHILAHLPRERQTLLFSATLHTSVHRLGRAALKEPEMVSVHKNATSRTPERLKQVYMITALEKKVDTLFSFLRSHSQKKIIVFVSACKQVRFFYEAFKQLKPGPAMMELHGRQSLTKRMIVFKEFADRERAVALLCTDIAARGVDFPAVDWVVQVDCPDSVESYIHRVGRTARYESCGQSALFLLPSEEAFVEKLKAARIGIKSIATKQGKVSTIQQKLNGLLAGDTAIKHLAQKAFASYVRSIALMKDKAVFKVKELPNEDFAMSLGLAMAPELLGVTSTKDGAEGGNIEANPLKKQKNQSALQRLRDKIAAKKKAAARGGANEDDEAREEQEELAGEGSGAARKKLGRWERRQKRIADAAAKAKASVSRQDSEEQQHEEDELFQPVGSVNGAADGLLATIPSATGSSLAAPTARQRRLRINKDGVAHSASGQHKFFDSSGVGATSELAQLAQELRGEGFGGGAADDGGRSSFLKRVAADLAKRDTSDAAVSRARIHERHQKKRRKGKEDRREDGDDIAPALVGGTSDGDSDGAGASRSPSPAEFPGRRGPAPPREASRSPSPAEFPGRRGPAPPRERAVDSRSRKAIASPSSTLVATPAKVLAGDDLGALEREALSRLGGGGLFA